MGYKVSKFARFAPLLFAGLVGVASLPLQAETHKMAIDGVFTEAQSDRGAEVFETCGTCHEVQPGAEPIGPSLEGTAFIDHFREDALDGLVSYIKEKMPRDKPGTLDDKAVLDVVAYLLRSNGYQLGNGELTMQTAADTLMVGADGPRPLGSNVPVMVIGCLAQGTRSWTVSQSTEPARARVVDAIAPEEIKAAAATPLSNRKFGLPNLEEFKTDFNADAFKGHKVLVKGTLTRQNNNDRVAVRSFESLSATCDK